MRHGLLIPRQQLFSTIDYWKSLTLYPKNDTCAAFSKIFLCEYPENCQLNPNKHRYTPRDGPVPSNNAHCLTDNSDISTEPDTLYVKASAPSRVKCHHPSTIIGRVSFLGALCILQLTHTSSSVHQLKNKWHS